MHGLDAYESIWCVDSEFGGPDGGLPEVRCVVGVEYRTHRTIRVWLDDVADPPIPFTCGPNDLFVAYLTSAELNCYRRLGLVDPR